MTTDLSGLDIDEVSIVRKPATRKRWAMFKSADDGSLELTQDVVDALSTPTDTEAPLVDALEAGGASESTTEAALCIYRLACAFGDTLPQSLGIGSPGLGVAGAPDAPADADDIAKGDTVAGRILLRIVAKGAGGEHHTPQEQDAVDRGAPAAHDLTGLDEENAESDAGDDDAEGAAEDEQDATDADLTKSYSADERKAMAATGEARPDGSYPIRTRADVKHAVEDFNRPGSTEADRAHIVKRARAIDAHDALPETWGVAKSAPASIENRILSRVEKALQR